MRRHLLPDEAAAHGEHYSSHGWTTNGVVALAFRDKRLPPLGHRWPVFESVCLVPAKHGGSLPEVVDTGEWYPDEFCGIRRAYRRFVSDNGVSSFVANHYLKYVQGARVCRLPWRGHEPELCPLVAYHNGKPDAFVMPCTVPF